MKVRMMASKIASAALQYSKRLSRFICWVWAIYRFTILLVSAIQPSIASAAASTIAGMDTIMMVNVSTYLVNSLGEKIIYSDRFALKWLEKGGFNSLIAKVIDQNKTDSEEDEEEEGDNG